MSELKPCPNPECCGIQIELMGTGHPNSWVECMRCHVTGPVKSDSCEAIRLWNLLPRTEQQRAYRDSTAAQSAEGPLLHPSERSGGRLTAPPVFEQPTEED